MLLCIPNALIYNFTLRLCYKNISKLSYDSEPIVECSSLANERCRSITIR
jgi:hypothetical protein